MDDWNRFKETALPPKEAFYGKLNMSGVSDQHYKHARRVWREFGLNDLEEYHDLYLKTDVILLAMSSKLLGGSVWITMDWTKLTSIWPLG